MNSEILPPRPRKWPLDLEVLGRGSVNFSKNTFFKSGQSTEKNELSFLVKLWKLPDFNSASSRPPRKCCWQKFINPLGQNTNNNLCTQHILQVLWTYNFHEQSVVILWISWCKNKSFWQRVTCKFLCSFQEFIPNILCSQHWFFQRMIAFQFSESTFI